ncbi:MAG: glycerophosphodiester phosphodiesterase family protein [Gammaproteobacteria bacterium]
MKSTRFLHLVARGGDAAGHPENTLPAFQSALDLGVRFVEVDVQLSSNGVPMAVRGEDVSVDGVLLSVSELTAAELAQVDSSEAHRFGQRFSGTCIPRLVDVLSLITKRPETTVFVNLCRASLGRFGPDQVVAQVAEAVKPFRSRCIVVSADLPAVHRARRLTSLQIGWEIPAFDNHTRLKYEALQPEYLFCDFAILPPRGALWRGPWRWAVRAAATLDDALDLAARGAEFVCTRDPRSLGEAMKAHAAALARVNDTNASSDASTVVNPETLLTR